MRTTTLLRFALSAVHALAFAGAAQAQAFPAKPVTIVVPYAPGGGADILARALGQKLTAAWGQPVLIDNRAGAGGSLGTAFVAKAPADGYTLLMASPSHTINGALYKNLSFDAVKNFSPIVLVASGPLALVVPANSPNATLKDFVRNVRAKPGSLNYASAGIGSSPHLAGELFSEVAKTRMVHIAYKGTAPALTDLLGGQVQAMFAPVPTIVSYLKAGTLKALAVTSAQPFGALPGVPPVASELPGYEVLQWWGLVAPTGTPPAVIAKIHADVAAALRAPDMRERLDAMGADAGGQPSAQFAALIDAEVPKWAAVIRSANVQPE